MCVWKNPQNTFCHSTFFVCTTIYNHILSNQKRLKWFSIFNVNSILLCKTNPIKWYRCTKIRHENECSRWLNDVVLLFSCFVGFVCLFACSLCQLVYFVYLKHRIHYYSKIKQIQTWFSKAPINHVFNCANPLHISLLNVKRILLNY